MKVCPVCGAEYGDEAAFCARDRAPLAVAGGALVGQLLADRYQIERKLGEGGMGEVYLARHLMMGRQSAIKVVSAGLSRDPDAIGRFSREATNASRISHPNVCAVYDFGVTAEGSFYLAMEYVEGRTLSEALRPGPLPLERAVAILRQCAAGLAAAHELGIVHRDLKPDNIMLLDHKGRETVKVVDFGIAKAATGELAQRVTQTGLVVGTPEYMSPEQVGGDEVDGRSDQYSLALLFVRMITGSAPFTATSAHEMMAKRLAEGPRPLADLAPGLTFPPGLQAVIDRAAARSVNDRYPSIEAFADAVAQAASPGVRLDTTLPPTTVVRPPTKLWRQLAAGGVAVTLVAAAFAAWRSQQRPPAVAARLPDPPAAPTTVVLPSVADSAVESVDGPPPNVASPPPATPNPATPKPAPPPKAPAEFVPGLEDFIPPLSGRAQRAYGQAVRIFESTNATDSLRAEMGLLMSVHLLDLKQEAKAQKAVRDACNLYRLTVCESKTGLFKKDVP